MIVTIPRLIIFVLISFGAFIACLLGLVRFIRQKLTRDDVFLGIMYIFNGIWMFLGALEYVGLTAYFPFNMYRLQLPLFIAGVLLPYFYFARIYKPFFKLHSYHIFLILNPAAAALICLLFPDSFFFSYKTMGLSLISTQALPTILISLVLYTSSVQFLIQIIVLLVMIIKLFKYGSSISKAFLRLSAVMCFFTLLFVIIWIIDRLLSLGLLPVLYLYAAAFFCSIFLTGSVVPVYKKGDAQ